MARSQILFAVLSVAALLLATIYAAIVSFRAADGSAGPRWLFPQNTGRRTRILAAIFTVVWVAALGLWVGTSVRQATRNPSRYLIPDGYVGWVRVEYQVPGAPPLPVENGRLVLRVPPDGALRTSSPEGFGWAKDEFAYFSGSGLRPLSQTGWGGGGMIWGRINGEAVTAAGRRQYEEFFVGTEQQFKQSVNLKEDAGPRNPVPGR